MGLFFYFSQLRHNPLAFYYYFLENQPSILSLEVLFIGSGISMATSATFCGQPIIKSSFQKVAGRFQDLFIFIFGGVFCLSSLAKSEDASPKIGFLFISRYTVDIFLKEKLIGKDILCELLLNLINIPAVVIKVHLPGGYRGFIFLFLIFVFSRVSHLARHSFSINWWFMMNACGLENMFPKMNSIADRRLQKKTIHQMRRLLGQDTRA